MPRAKSKQSRMKMRRQITQKKKKRALKAKVKQLKKTK